MGIRPWTGYALINLVTNGSSVSTDSRTRNVGTGSIAQDLIGDDTSRRRTSCWVYGLKQEIHDEAMDDTGCGGNPAVSE